jgi:hypothetical protein
VNRIRWAWRRWRANHYVWKAMNEWMTNPTDWTSAAYDRALDLRDRVWAARP